ncbi:MAG TPA: TatD family hydrolase [Methanobacterium sp.]|nr:TatD family hydrolase [Methanobacterium sp.]
MIDGHIHADTRPYEDFKLMAIAGVDSAITCAHDPLKMSTSAVVLDHIQRILNSDFKRAADNGLKLYGAVGIHPRSISPDYNVVLDELPSILSDDKVIAIGEIGLETTSDQEKEIFKIQLEMAQKLEMKVIVHTPRRKKREVTKTTLSLLDEYIDQSLVQLDHVDNSIIDLVVDFKGLRGITVQPQKMTPQEAVALLDVYGTDGFILDSDMSSSPSDPLSVPKTVHEMKMAGFKSSNIKNVSEGNVSRFYGL